MDVLVIKVVAYPFWVLHFPKHGEAKTRPKEKAPTAYPNHTEFPPKSCTSGHMMGKVTPRVISPTNTTQQIMEKPDGSARPSAVIVEDVVESASS